MLRRLTITFVLTTSTSLLACGGPPLPEDDQDPRLWPLPTAGGGVTTYRVPVPPVDDGGLYGDEPCETDDSDESPDVPMPELDPMLTTSLVDDDTLVDSLNAAGEATAAPADLVEPPSWLLADAWTLRQNLSTLEGETDPEQYEADKDTLYQPLIHDIDDAGVDVIQITEVGAGGVSIDELFDAPVPREPLEDAFDLRVRPAACQEYTEAAEADNALRYYPNIGVSQVYHRKVCLQTGDSIEVRTFDLDPTLDTVVHVWDPQAGQSVAFSDDEVSGFPESFLSFHNEGDDGCFTILVANRIPRVAGRGRVEVAEFSPGDSTVVADTEVELRSFPVELHYGAPDVDFEVAMTRHTELPRTPTTIPLMLLAGTELVGFDYDSGVGPAAKVYRSTLGGRIPSSALVLGRSIEARDFTLGDAYLNPSDVAAFRMSHDGPSDLPLDLAPDEEPLPESNPLFAAAIDTLLPVYEFPPLLPEGRVDLVLDEAGPVGPPHDDDGDGIGALTEAQLCTCDADNREHNPAGWYDWCDDRSDFLDPNSDLFDSVEPTWHADTDHDGLTDREEIFGVELDLNATELREAERVFRTLALPIMGAEALHKDVFVEMDYELYDGHEDPLTMQGVATRKVSATNGLPTGARLWRAEYFQRIADLYGEGETAFLRNPTGLPGIHVHVDVGAEPVRSAAGEALHCDWTCAPTDPGCHADCEDNVGLERVLHRRRVFGDWGGGGTRIPHDYHNPTTTWTGAEAMLEFCASPDATARPDACPWFADVDPVKGYTLAFFLTHNEHRRPFGRYALVDAASRGSGQADGNAFGAILDATVFGHELGHQVGLSHWGRDEWGKLNCKPNYLSVMNYSYQRDSFGFSSADGDATWTLDPSSFQELNLPFAGLTPEKVAMLDGGVFRFMTNATGLDDNGDGTAHIDWNLSRTHDAGDLRGPATWCPGAGGGFNTQNVEWLATYEPDAWAGKGATPDLARVGNRLFAAYVDDEGQLWYRHGELGPKATGSCASQGLGEDCIDWADPEQVLPPQAESVLGVSIAEWSGRLVVGYVEEVSADDCRLRLGVTNSLVGGDGISSLTMTGGIWHVECEEPELVELPVHAAFDPSGRLMTALVRAEGGLLMELRSADPLELGSWEIAPAVDSTGAPIYAALPVAATVWPSPDWDSLGSLWADTATTCAVIPAATAGNPRIRFYCGNRFGRWFEDEDFEYEPREILGKPALAFHIMRDADGEPVDALDLPGQFWLAFPQSGGDDGSYRTAAIKVSDLIWRYETPLAYSKWDFWFEGRYGGTWHYINVGTGPALYEDLYLGALKGMLNRLKGYEFDPFADGSFALELRAGNDFKVMESQMCRPLRPYSDHCQSEPSQTRWGY